MAYLAVDKDGSEWVFNKKPFRNNNGNCNNWYNLDSCYNKGCVVLPQGAIKKLIGRELTWEDEAVKL